MKSRPDLFLMNFKELIVKWNLPKLWKKASNSTAIFQFSFWSTPLACSFLMCSLLDFLWSAFFIGMEPFRSKETVNAWGWSLCDLFVDTEVNIQKHEISHQRNNRKCVCVRGGGVCSYFYAVCVPACWVHGLVTNDLCQIQTLDNHCLK